MKTLLLATFALTLPFVAHADDSAMQTPACDHALVAALTAAKTPADLQNLQNLAQDIGDYDAQGKLVAAAKGGQRTQLMQVQEATQKSIYSDFQQLQASDGKSAAAVAVACSIE